MPIETGTRNADFFAGSPEPDLIDGRGGDDYLFGGYADDTLLGGAGNDTLTGSFDRDSLVGGAGDDSLAGGEDDDVLSGGAGQDTLLGDSGLRAGVDTLEGGGGADLFIFIPLVPDRTPIADTGIGEGHRDVVLDFGVGHDAIDLSAYARYLGPFHDASPAVFLGTGAFTDSNGLQVRYDALADGRAVVQFLGAEPSGAPPGMDLGPRLSGEIELVGVRHLDAGDFILG